MLRFRGLTYATMLKEMYYNLPAGSKEQLLSTSCSLFEPTALISLN